MSEFNDPEVQKEYELEVARAKARLDVEFSDQRIKDRNRRNRHITFGYTALMMLLSTAVGFWISYFTR